MQIEMEDSANHMDNMYSQNVNPCYGVLMNTQRSSEDTDLYPYIFTDEHLTSNDNIF
ncbi:MAG: hypothetical protein IKH38_01795 [Clostridia bacterium]|nr:hypothetical protein [Clostridia bacterium]